MGVASLARRGVATGRPRVVVLGSEEAAAVKNLDPGTFQGGSSVPLGLVRGEDVIRGVTPPETEVVLGEGALPPAPPFPTELGGGESIGTARPRQLHPDWLTQVMCQPPPLPPATGASFPKVPEGRAKGPKEPQGPDLSSQT